MVNVKYKFSFNIIFGISIGTRWEIKLFLVGLGVVGLFCVLNSGNIETGGITKWGSDLTPRGWHQHCSMVSVPRNQYPNWMSHRGINFGCHHGALHCNQVHLSKVWYWTSSVTYIMFQWHNIAKSSPWIWKGAYLQSGSYTLSYPRGRLVRPDLMKLVENRLHGIWNQWKSLTTVNVNVGTE